MKISNLLAPFLFLSLSCSETPWPFSENDVTHVEHSTVKQQAIGNCWLYAQASWLESMLQSSWSKEVDVSETYWEYWDLYEKLISGSQKLDDSVNTGGSWFRSNHLIETYGWIEEGLFIKEESGMIKSSAQACAEKYIARESTEGGRLGPQHERTPSYVKSELNKAFSCGGQYAVDIDEAFELRHSAADTMLRDPKNEKEKSLVDWLDDWTEVHNSTRGYAAYEGKKLPSRGTLATYRSWEKRLKRALNDHQPVVLSFFVSFNAPDQNGLFNLNTLAQKGSLGQSGGHMVVLHDYTVTHVPLLDYVGEGERDAETKEAALLGDLDYVVVKNSWGAYRDDRPWLGDGYSRITWDYLTKTYWDEESQAFYPFLQSLVFPPGY